MEMIKEDCNMIDIELNNAIPKRFFFEERFPFPECSILEFKRSFRGENRRRYLETGCAFLNSGGGYLIFGIVDNDRTILGCRMGVKDIDDFNIFADSFYNQIIHHDGSLISIGTVSTRIEKITKNRYICILKFTPENGMAYQLPDGTYYRRANASNKKYSNTRLYHSNEVAVFVKKAENERDRMISAIERKYRDELTDYSEEIDKLRDNEKSKDEFIINMNTIMYNYYRHPINKPTSVNHTMLYIFGGIILFFLGGKLL
jgi:predicted HTH transcriptional regulator